jgi:hypothetical protein
LWCQIRGTISPTTAHHGYAVQIFAASDFNQTDGDCPLVAQIKPKAEYLDAEGERASATTGVTTAIFITRNTLTVIFPKPAKPEPNRLK